MTGASRSNARTAARVAQAFQVAVFVAWSYPGLYDLAVHVLHVGGELTLPGGWRLQRAHLFPLGVDGGIVTAFILLVADRGDLESNQRRELWAGMWACAGLSAIGLVVDALKAGAGWASPLVAIPVALGTWFLHMVVEQQPRSVATAAADLVVAESLTSTPPPLAEVVAVQPPQAVASTRPGAVAARSQTRSQVTAHAAPAVPFTRRQTGPCDCSACGGKRVSWDTWRRHHETATDAAKPVTQTA